MLAIHRGAYRALPSPACLHTQTGWSATPGICRSPPLEDKIVQRATAAVLSARSTRKNCLGFSMHRFRPGRATHDAMDALLVGISSTKVNWILDADILVRAFDTMSPEWLIRFSVEHRVGDRAYHPPDPEMAQGGASWKNPRVVTVTDKGTGRGSVILTASRLISTCTTSSISGPSAGDGANTAGNMIIRALRRRPHCRL